MLNFVISQQYNETLEQTDILENLHFHLERFNFPTQSEYVT